MPLRSCCSHNYTDREHEVGRTLWIIVLQLVKSFPSLNKELSHYRMQCRKHKCPQTNTNKHKHQRFHPQYFRFQEKNGVFLCVSNQSSRRDSSCEDHHTHTHTPQCLLIYQMLVLLYNCGFYRYSILSHTLKAFQCFSSWHCRPLIQTPDNYIFIIYVTVLKTSADILLLDYKYILFLWLTKCK